LKTSPQTGASIDALEADYLYTGLSQLPGAGQGLFTAIALYTGETIAVFAGDVLSGAEATLRAAKGNDRYFISLPDGSTLDSMYVACFAKYANDAQGHSASRFKNNARIVLDDNDAVCIQAKRNIKAAEELFCGYGRRYWERHG
jgi:hypothetical protein